MKKYVITILIAMLASVSAFGQTQSPPTLRIVTEDANLPSELFYGAVKVKPLRLRPGTNVPITIEDADFFVNQQYIDFLGRFPDQPGLAHWTSEITICNDPASRRPDESEAQCVDRKRTNTSGAFFLSPEHQNTGYFVYRVYKGTLGRMAKYDEFMPEMRQVARGIVVSDALSPGVINTNKRAFVNAFVGRAEFKAIYDGLNNTQFVDKLFETTGVMPSAADRTALINSLSNATETRAGVVFNVVDGTRTVTGGQMEFQTTYGKAFYDKEFNAAFVLMEYFGYLRRDPDAPGYAHWLAKLNSYGNFVDAEMVRAFIVSPEFRSRF